MRFLQPVKNCDDEDLLCDTGLTNKEVLGRTFAQRQKQFYV